MEFFAVLSLIFIVLYKIHTYIKFDQYNSRTASVTGELQSPSHVSFASFLMKNDVQPFANKHPMSSLYIYISTYNDLKLTKTGGCQYHWH